MKLANKDINNRVLFVYPSKRDLRELSVVNNNHTYDLIYEYEPQQEEPDIDTIINSISKKYSYKDLSGVTATRDYPASCVASILAHHYNLPGVDPEVNILLQNKYLSRRKQLEFAPEAVPDVFKLYNTKNTNKSLEFHFPLFVKPIKSYFSMGAFVAYTYDDIDKYINSLEYKKLNESFLPLFKNLCKTYGNIDVGDDTLLCESLLSGDQITLDGFVYNNEVTIMGIVDSIKDNSNISIDRFDYPSNLSQSVQDRMSDIAKRIMSGVKFNNNLFNIEFIYNSSEDRIYIIEINTRMSHQFGDMYEKVDGVNLYSIMLDVATGRKPKIQRNNGKYKLSWSYMLRSSIDKYIERIPTDKEIKDIINQYPDTRIEIRAKEGKRLSDIDIQDPYNYHYGIITVGANSKQEAEEKYIKIKDQLNLVLEDVK